MKKYFTGNRPYTVCILVDKKLGKKFKGVAVCNEAIDIFNEAKGRAIAEEKAYIKRDEYRAKNLLQNYYGIQKAAEQLTSDIDKRLDKVNERLEERYTTLHSLVGLNDE